MAHQNPFRDSGKSFHEILEEYLHSKLPADVKLGQPLALAIHEFKIEIRGLAPAVWRRVQVPNELTLHQLHQVIQCVFGWSGFHLHCFKIQKASYGMPDPSMPEVFDEEERRICDFAARKGTKWHYEYDFGDSWGHVLTLEKVLPWQDNFDPVCLKGTRACPPEDSGGPPGYWRKLQIMRDPTHKEHEEVCDWMGRDWDPERFDLNSINLRLKQQFTRLRQSRRKKS
jgi:hypothetical protein